MRRNFPLFFFRFFPLFLFFFFDGFADAVGVPPAAVVVAALAISVRSAALVAPCGAGGAAAAGVLAQGAPVGGGAEAPLLTLVP